MKQYTLNAELLNGVKLAKGEGCPRYELNSVFVWDDAFKRNYMATNGHIMFLATDDRFSNDPLIDGVIAFDFKGTIKARSHELPKLILNDDGTASIFSTKENKPIKLTGAKMPEGWEKIIPPKNSDFVQNFTLFNGEYLRRVQQFLGFSAYSRPQTTCDDSRSPVAWITPDKTAIIMPIRM